MTRWTAGACVLALLALVLATAALWKTHQLASHKHPEPHVPRCAAAEKDYNLVIADARHSREEAASAFKLATLDSTSKTKYPTAYQAFHVYFSAHYNTQDPSGAPWIEAREAASVALVALGLDKYDAWNNSKDIAEAYPARTAVRRAAQDAARALAACGVLAECRKRRQEFACYSNGEYRP